MRGACPLSTLPVMGYLSFRKSISAVDVLLQADKAYCSLTKKAAFGAQHNRQTGTFRLYRASRRVRHDRACEKTKVFSCVLFLINTTVIIFHKKAYNPPSPMRMPLWILCGSCNFFLLVVIFIKIVSDRNEKYFKQYRFYSSSDNSFVPPVVFHDTKGTFCLNGSVHP